MAAERRSVIRDLVGTPLDRLRPTRLVVLDWYDGPLEGLLEFTAPGTAWRYRLFAERRPPEDIDERFMLLSEVPFELWLELVGFLTDAYGPQGSSWVPNGKLPVELRAVEDDLLSRLERSAREPELMIRADMLPAITGIWALR
jgi:hypothetical protein